VGEEDGNERSERRGGETHRIHCYSEVEGGGGRRYHPPNPEKVKGGKDFPGPQILQKPLRRVIFSLESLENLKGRESMAISVGLGETKKSTPGASIGHRYQPKVEKSVGRYRQFSCY